MSNNLSAWLDADNPVDCVALGLWVPARDCGTFGTVLNPHGDKILLPILLEEWRPVLATARALLTPVTTPPYKPE